MKTLAGRGVTTLPLLLFFLAAVGISGCAEKAEVSPAEQANWKGGPMPADFKPDLGQGPPKAQSAPATASAPSPTAK